MTIWGESKLPTVTFPNNLFPYETMMSRIQRNSSCVGGNDSPLGKIKQHIVDFMLYVPQIKLLMTPSDVLEIINQLIHSWNTWIRWNNKKDIATKNLRFGLSKVEVFKGVYRMQSSSITVLLLDVLIQSKSGMRPLRFQRKM